MAEDIEDLKNLEDREVVSKKRGQKVEGPLLKVKLVYSSETEVIKPREELKRDDLVIVNSRYGRDIARVLGVVKNPYDVVKEDIVQFIRACSPKDLSRLESNNEKEKKAFKQCSDKIKSLGLDMKLTGVHYLLDEPKILFYFTADNRVDFRELVKSLVSIFKMRIELRQIGVRDESRLLGAVGVCGRVICCHGVTDNLKPVSIKMAKEQNLSLNSMKISGPCGRLLCCLEYEFDFYEKEKSRLPRQGARIKYRRELFTVDDVNLFSKSIVVSSESRSFVKVSFDDLKRTKNGWIITNLIEE